MEQKLYDKQENATNIYIIYNLYNLDLWLQY